uniref:Biotin transporter BioY n=1 Tax=Ignisphaera aggregans TaxID=334771 RepID=A0A7C5XGH1_9CREN
MKLFLGDVYMRIYNNIISTIIRIVFCVVLAVITGVLAQAIFYLGPVPYTMQNTGVVLSALLLPPRYALFSQLLYLMLIAFGFPIASGFRGGLAVLLGYTGGYLAGFPIASTAMSVLSKWYLKRVGRSLARINRKDFIILLAFSAIASIPIYILGFIVFTGYALSNEGLLQWAEGISKTIGLTISDKFLMLFTASVAIFVPQDILMDHVVALAMAKTISIYLESRGIDIEQ